MESEVLYVSSMDAGVIGSRDPMVGVMGLLRPRAVVPAPLHAASPWAVRFAPFPHVKLGVVVDGRCWLTLDGHEPLLLEEGDFYLLGHPPQYTLSSSRDAVSALSAATLPPNTTGRGFRIGTEAGEDSYTCSVDFTFDAGDTSMLLDVLPRVVHVRAGDPRGALFMNLASLLVFEIESPSVGRSLVLEHLAQIILVHMLRAHAGNTDQPGGWLAALADDGIGAALRAMHEDVSRRWTLAELAEIGRMSRSAFAAAFKARVGTPPLTYLIKWRMTLARDALRNGSLSNSELAAATGYESESAFSTAFRREVGSSPRHYRHAAR
ncbi:AraC family transcriptional regulator [Amycolatopsis sp. A133]|uniref:AraC family transcriptional regulator n=1 Tax=Amycolatopsis sp. A133 TaxID=3064472 RepID=UPI0027F6B0C0|nr:AraC family transcriptional regulator [Amycolatopsis sp. A133]MDQ7802418.1 AraC family transcriptional regulator [Amycolatopsis sp. A133]